MASRSVWKGFIRFGLVSVPVKAYTAAVSSGGEIRLNQLHGECHSRINYKKSCPQHGEIPNDQIVSGYEFAPGQYVIIDEVEVEKLAAPDERAVDIAAFIAPNTLDSGFYNGKTYYLVPDGQTGAKAFGLLHRAMKEEDKYAFAQVVLRGRKEAVLLRSLENILAMTFLNYEQEMKDPGEFTDEAPKVEASPQELKLAKTLVTSLATDDFDYAQYRDDYTDRMRKLIEAKVHGKQIISPPAVEERAQATNLMEALQKSLAAAKKAATGKPAKLVAPSAAAPAREQRKRKSS